MVTIMRCHNWEYNTMAKRKRTNNDLQNTTQKTKDWATRTQLKTEAWTRVLRKGSISCSTCGTRHVTFVNPLTSHKWGKHNISVISWRSVLLVEETGEPVKNNRPVTSHWQTLSHNVVSSTTRHERDSNSQR